MNIIGWYWAEGYDFINSSGEHIKGETRKALILDCDNNGAVVHSRIVKVAKQCPPLPCGEQVADVYYDAYGKLLGVHVDET